MMSRLKGKALPVTRAVRSQALRNAACCPGDHDQVIWTSSESDAAAGPQAGGPGSGPAGLRRCRAAASLAGEMLKQ
jgi:hypothetical protein